MLPETLVATDRPRVQAAVARVLATPPESPDGAAPIPAALLPARYPHLLVVDVLWLFPQPHPRLAACLRGRGPNLHLVAVGFPEDTEASVAALTAGLWVDVLEDRPAVALSQMAGWAGRDRHPYEVGGLVWAQVVRRLLAAAQEEQLLSPRQKEAVDLAREGMSNPEIARAMGIRVKTVKNFLTVAFDKLEVSGRWAAMALDPNPPGHRLCRRW